jgi:hypothetical protein
MDVHTDGRHASVHFVNYRQAARQYKVGSSPLFSAEESCRHSARAQWISTSPPACNGDVRYPIQVR